ncbi:hypothetical protein MFIFM68171_01093 [Madurella fahalii]|uniref:Luciferase domain-containing protein n=1 Tax=Madurella fahalii TaxID=1157608 RepID=A0ABQ0FZH3_9PEZI
MPFFKSFSDIWPPVRSRTFTIIAFTVPVALLLLLPRLIDSYRAYLSLGPGGLPHNPLGYLIQAALRPIARWDLRADPPPYRNHRSSAAVVARYAPHGLTSFLPQDIHNNSSGGNRSDDLLPPRTPPRPEVPDFVAPQRQATQPASGPMIARMQGFLRALAARNPSLLEIRPSGLEGVGTDAVYLKATPPSRSRNSNSSSSSGSGSSQGHVGDVGREEQEAKAVAAVVVPEYMGMAKAEIVHVHGEGSSHVTMSLVDAEAAVKQGWAERHPLTGVPKMLPWGYVLLYAPRDDVEYELWTKLVVAGCRFVAGGREIAGVSETTRQ